MWDGTIDFMSASVDVNRREFLVTKLTAGFALAVQPVSAAAITTDTKGITSIGALSLLANAVLFTIYVNTHRDNTAKGIFLTTVIYGIGILVLKILN